MMSDKELLEMAAKAAGIEFGGYDEARGLLLYWDNPTEKSAWNPLADSGDALGLIVKLKLDITFLPDGIVEVMNGDTDENLKWAWEKLTNRNHESEVRRCIVRVAADMRTT